MSVKSIIQDVFHAISRFWGGLKPQIQKAVHTGILVVEAIKKFDAANPLVGDIITNLIPGEADDFVKQKLRAAMPQILAELNLISNGVDQTISAEEFVVQAIAELQKLTGLKKAIALDSLSKLVTDVAADHRIDWDDLAYVNKWYYDNIYRTKPAA